MPKVAARGGVGAGDDMEIDFHTKSAKTSMAIFAFMITIIGFAVSWVGYYTRGIEWVDGVNTQIVDLSKQISGLQSQEKENTTILNQHGQALANFVPQVKRIEDRTDDTGRKIDALGGQVHDLSSQLSEIMRHSFPMRGGALESPHRQDGWPDVLPESSEGHK